MPIEGALNIRGNMDPCFSVQFELMKVAASNAFCLYESWNKLPKICPYDPKQFFAKLLIDEKKCLIAQEMSSHLLFVANESQRLHSHIATNAHSIFTSKSTHYKYNLMQLRIAAFTLEIKTNGISKYIIDTQKINKLKPGESNKLDAKLNKIIGELLSLVYAINTINKKLAEEPITNLGVGGIDSLPPLPESLRRPPAITPPKVNFDLDSNEVYLIPAYEEIHTHKSTLERISDSIGNLRNRNRQNYTRL